MYISYVIAKIDAKGDTEYYHMGQKQWFGETTGATAFASAYGAHGVATGILHRADSRLKIMKATTTVEPFQDVPLEDEEPKSQIIYALRCADNPCRYLGRAGSWVEFYMAPCFPTAEEALEWRATMARCFPHLNFKSNAVLEVKEMKPGTITFRTADADGNMTAHPLSELLKERPR